MQAVLVMFRNDGERRSFSISREMTVIGRRQDCDLMIPLGEISRKHCRIIRDGDSLRLEDLGSSNGTFHNGRRVQEAVLSAGDTVQVGPVAFVLQIDGVPAEDEMQPHTGGAAAAPAGRPARAAAAATTDDDELETLSDDGEPTPGSELDSANDDDEELESLEADDDDTTKPIGLDDDDEPKPLRRGLALDDELEVLSSDSEPSANISDLDAEIGENLDLGHDPLEGLDDSTAGDVTLDDEKPKPRRK
jgi:predicted component of type VI protein secretion system